MQLRPISVKMPAGLAFEIPDLLIMRGWAEFHDLEMTIELDIGEEGDDYEEMLSLYDPRQELLRWILWRSCDGIMVQAAAGRVMLFDQMMDVLAILNPDQE